MCGICGVAYSRRSGRLPSEGSLRRMRDVLEHRGPDESGLRIEGCVGLGHRRLSIVDLAAGQQPMSSPDGRYTIVYNGEVFNHTELRQRLEASGAPFRTRCDTEAVLRSYAAWGEEAPSMLRGMFAFAIWDRLDGELFLARDRFGVKPLYYALDGDGSLHFASEIKALLASGAVRPALNRRALPDHLANRATSGAETLYEGVMRLLPGHTLRWRDGACSVRRYWNLSYTERSGVVDDRHVVAEYGERLEEAVRLRLMSDVPLGVFLSGGIDSAAIAAITSDLVGDRIKTFSVAFREPRANELPWARLVAQRYRTDHHEVELSPERFFELLPQMVWHEDEPLAHPSSVALFAVAELASRHVKVVLTGEGSDETLAGYGRYPRAVLNMRAGRIYERAVPSVARHAMRELILRAGARTRIGRRASRTFLCESADVESSYLDNFGVFSRARLGGLLTQGFVESVSGIDPYRTAMSVLGESDATSTLHRLLDLDTRTYLHELLMKQDQMSMAASIESRVPFLDHPLVEFVASLPSRLKLRGMTGKWLLRRSMAGRLPEPILTRGKMGFPVPIAEWFRGGYRHVVDDLVLGPRAAARGLFDAAYVRKMVEEDRRGHADHWERIWALVNLELWQRVFLDGDALDPGRTTTGVRSSGRVPIGV